MEVKATARYKNYLLALLLVVAAFNYVDRFALGLVLENIKADLHLSDAQLGLLTGIAYALFYAFMGIPIARWADRGNRVTIIILTTVVWSFMVALSGAATSFAQLMLIRVVVGIGEAGCVPPAYSLFGDYFNRAERPRANAVYQQAANISLIIAYFVAGWLNQLYGWRVMFVIVALPGFVIAVLTWLTIEEPRRRRPLERDKKGSMPSSTREPESGPAVTASQASMKEVLKTLWGNSTFRHLLYAISLYYFLGYGTMQWQPAFLERSFGVQSGELGTWLAAVYGVSGILGTYWGGVWASRYAPNNEGLQLKAMAVINVVFNGAAWAMIYLASNLYWALGFMGLATLGGTTINGPLFSTMQTLVPAHMRAVSVALVLLFANLIGMGFGPLAAGVLSDALRPLFGQESLRYALLCMCLGFIWLSWHLWHASTTVMRELPGEPVEPVTHEGASLFSVPATEES